MHGWTLLRDCEAMETHAAIFFSHTHSDTTSITFWSSKTQFWWHWKRLGLEVDFGTARVKDGCRDRLASIEAVYTSARSSASSWWPQIYDSWHRQGPWLALTESSCPRPDARKRQAGGPALQRYATCFRPQFSFSATSTCRGKTIS